MAVDDYNNNKELTAFLFLTAKIFMKQGEIWQGSSEEFSQR